eukprot:1650919-Ditylum_brightwellii.AAC.1
MSFEYDIPLPPPSGDNNDMFSTVQLNNKMEDKHGERKDMWVMRWDNPVKTCWIVWLSLQQICDVMPMAQLKREERERILCDFSASASKHESFV